MIMRMIKIGKNNIFEFCLINGYYGWKDDFGHLLYYHKTEKPPVFSISRSTNHNIILKFRKHLYI